MRPLASVLVAAAIVVVSAASVHAQDARAEFRTGQAAYDRGDYDTAIGAWNRAYELDPRPLILFNLSQAYERLGRLGEAASALERYLSTADPNDPQQGQAQARLAAIRQRLGQTSVRITGAPEGARITIDGQEWGVTPRPDPISVAPGSHRIVLSRDGYQDFQATVVVPAGQSVEVAAEMQVGGGGGSASGGDTVQLASGPADEGGGSSVVPWILIGGGAALFATGAILGAVALGKAQDAPDGNGDEADSARTLALVGDIGMLLGIGAAATGVVLLFTSSGDGEEAPPAEPQLQLAGYVDGTGAGAVVGGTF